PPMNDEAKSRMLEMARDVPSTKSGFVRFMLPAIEDALTAGHTIKAVWECLRTQNPSLGYKELCVYLRRIQKSPTRSQTARTSGKKQTVQVDTEAGKKGRADFDPLANLRRAEATRPGFHYRGTEDLEELVHGRKDHHGKPERRNA
ncbi:MAG: hypothetical protein ACRD4H_05745, partial [Candidatus Acidiferrales bacterium]